MQYTHPLKCNATNSAATAKVECNAQNQCKCWLFENKVIAMQKVNASPMPLHYDPPKKNKCIATQMPMQGKFQRKWTTQCQCKQQCHCKTHANDKPDQICTVGPMPMQDPCQCSTKPDLYCKTNANGRPMQCQCPPCPPQLLPNPHSSSCSPPHPNLTISALTLSEHNVTKYVHIVSIYDFCNLAEIDNI